MGLGASSEIDPAQSQAAPAHVGRGDRRPVLRSLDRRQLASDPKGGHLLDSTERGRQGECAMTTAQTRISALPLLRPAPARALVITIIAILPL